MRATWDCVVRLVSKGEKPFKGSIQREAERARPWFPPSHLTYIVTPLPRLELVCQDALFLQPGRTLAANQSEKCVFTVGT